MNAHKKNGSPNASDKRYVKHLAVEQIDVGLGPDLSLVNSMSS